MLMLIFSILCSVAVELTYLKTDLKNIYLFKKLFKIKIILHLIHIIVGGGEGGFTSPCCQHFMSPAAVLDDKTCLNSQLTLSKYQSQNKMMPCRWTWTQTLKQIACNGKAQRLSAVRVFQSDVQRHHQRNTEMSPVFEFSVYSGHETFYIGNPVS